MISFRISKPACRVCCRREGAAGAILGAALLAFLGVALGLPAQDQPPATQKTALPPDLERVPADAAFLLSVRVADLWNSDPVKSLRQQKAQELAEGIKGFEKEIGVA